MVTCVVVLWTAGCSEPPKERHLQVTQINDKVSEPEFQRFLKVVQKLPGGKLPELPAFFGPAPDWSPARTLPVRDLVKEENLSLSARWETETLRRHLLHDRALHRALRRADMSAEEFYNLVLALGAALCRNAAGNDKDLESLLEQAKIPLDRL